MSGLWGHMVGVVILLMMAVFIGIWVWAWRPRHRAVFDALSELPMREEWAEVDAGGAHGRVTSGPGTDTARRTDHSDRDAGNPIEPRRGRRSERRRDDTSAAKGHTR